MVFFGTLARTLAFQNLFINVRCFLLDNSRDTNNAQATMTSFSSCNQSCLLQCCDKAVIIEDSERGDYICTACGCVVGDHLVDTSAEWRSFENDTTDKSRVGAPVNALLDGADLTTEIVLTSSSKSHHVGKMKKLHTNKEAEILRDAFFNMDNMVANICLPARHLVILYFF